MLTLILVSNIVKLQNTRNTAAKLDWFTEHNRFLVQNMSEKP